MNPPIHGQFFASQSRRMGRRWHSLAGPRETACSAAIGRLSDVLSRRQRREKMTPRRHSPASRSASLQLPSRWCIGRLHASSQKWKQAREFRNDEVAKRAHPGGAPWVRMHRQVDLGIELGDWCQHPSSSCHGRRSWPVAQPASGMICSHLGIELDDGMVVQVPLWSAAAPDVGMASIDGPRWIGDLAGNKVSSPGSSVRTATSASPFPRSRRRSVMMRSTRSAGYFTRNDSISGASKRDASPSGHVTATCPSTPLPPTAAAAVESFASIGTR